MTKPLSDNPAGRGFTRILSGTDSSKAFMSDGSNGFVMGSPMTMFTAASSGAVPESGGGTSNYLRADGSWQAPTSGASFTILPAISGGTGLGTSGTDSTKALMSDGANGFTMGTPTGVAVEVNNNAPITSGTAVLAITKQPLVPDNGILQPLPPDHFLTGGIEALYRVSATGGPCMVCVGPDNRIWTGYINTGKLAAFSTTGVETLYNMTTGAFPYPYALCTGPDGRIWVADYNYNKIAAYTTDGTETVYGTTGSSNPVGICSGPDGRVWVTYQGTNKVAAFTTAGVETVYDTTGSSQPRCICSGPDGRLWVTYQNTNKIAAFTTAGVETVYNTTGSSQPYGICSGSDGRIWVAYLSTKKIAAFTTAGIETVYSIASNTDPYYLCAGSDGKIWRTCYNKNKIVSMTTLGVETSYTSTYNQIGICAGPDGRLWAASSGSSKIVAFDLTHNMSSISLTTPLAVSSGGTGLSTSGTDSTQFLKCNGSGGFVMGTPPSTTLSLFSSSASGEVPASGGGTSNFLRADGTWNVPVDPESFSLFTSSTSGMVPASGGGASNYLRADGSWQVPGASFTILPAISGGTGLGTSGVDASKVLKSDGANGYTMGTIYSSKLVGNIGSPTYTTLQDWMDVHDSAGLLNGSITVTGDASSVN